MKKSNGFLKLFLYINIISLAHFNDLKYDIESVWYITALSEKDSRLVFAINNSEQLITSFRANCSKNRSTLRVDLFFSRIFWFLVEIKKNKGNKQLVWLSFFLENFNFNFNFFFSSQLSYRFFEKSTFIRLDFGKREREREKKEERNEQKHRVINFRMKFALHDKKPVL